ncbi:MAG: hypothetical protein WC002_10135 [Candidatus Muiribacteriota bacterium]
MAKNYGFTAKEINFILKLTFYNKEEFIRSWNEYFNFK